MRTGSRFLLINLLVTLVASSFIKRVGFVITALLMLAALLPPIALAAPLAPSNLQASMVAGPPIGAALTWTDNSANEVGFKVERAIGGGAFTNITGLGLPQNSVAFTDTTVTAGVTYSYRVIAFNLDAAPDSAPSNTATILAIVTAAPTVLTATQQAGPPQTVTLSWTDNSNNEIGFRIERADDAGFTLNVVPNVRVANVAAAPVTFVDPDVMPGSTYFYRVASLSPFGASANSNTATITITAAAGMQAGPVVPVPGFPAPNGFPLYYQDTLGRKLELLPIGLVNFADPVIAGNPYSAALGFGTEAFYYLASADELDIGAGPGLFEFAIEAVFGSPDGSAAPGQEAVMARTRIRFDVPVNGDYTVQTPYGTRTFTGVVAGVPGFDVNFTEDVGAIPRIFSGPNSPIQPQNPVLNPNPITVFLRPVTPQLGDGIFGDGITPTAVTGGPHSNSVTITGPGINTTSSTWLINGRFSSGMALVPSFTTSLAPASGIAPVMVTFTDTTAGLPTSWLWDFGDGVTSTLQNPVHTYAAPGNFVAKLTTLNAGGSASTSQMISTFGIPLAPNGVAGETTAINQVTVTFTDNSTDETAFRVERADNALFTVGLTSFNVDAASGTANTLNLVDNTVIQGNAYFYRVFAVNVVGDSLASNTAQVIVGGGPTSPAAPGTLAATSVTPNLVVLSWVDSDNLETGFRIERATGAGPFAVLTSLPADSISFADTTVAPNTTYQYRVMAFNVVGVSLPSNVFMVTTPGVPTAVGGLITSNTTWTAANSPYVVTSSVLVNSGARLTIEPGVTVRFNSGKGMQIDGELIARGTETSPIFFTSNQAAPAPGDWVNILFSDSSTDAEWEGESFGTYTGGSILQHVIVEYAGQNDTPAVKMVSSSPFVDHAGVRNNGSSGILVQGGSPKVTNSTISDNHTGGYGGGIKIASGTVTLIGSTVSDNSATGWGGGIRFEGTSHGALSNNTITGNTTIGYGGGVSISFAGGTVTLNNNTISGNSANGSAAGIHVIGSTMTASNNTITNNTTFGSGGGVLIDGGTVTLGNNTISGNSANGWGGGGGVYVFAGSPMIDGNTITDNHSGGPGGGVYLGGGTQFQATLTHNRITGNTGANGVYVKQKTAVNQNEIHDNTTYDLYCDNPQGTPAVDATNNWWGTTNEADIQARIWDWFDDASLGIVNYSPFLASSPFGPSGAISGHVYEADGVTPISGATVEVRNFDSTDILGTATTLADGSYVIADLADGSYAVNGWATGHVRRWWQDTLPRPQATAVVVADGNVVSNIDFSLEPGGTISGNIVSQATGLPLPDVSVDVSRVDGISGSGRQTSDENGNFTIKGMPFGQYKVGSPSSSRFGAGDGSYIREFYNNRGDLNSADIVTISAPAMDATGVNFALAQGGSISGHVADEGGNALAGATVAADFWAGGRVVTGVTDDAGNYTLLGLSDGDYRLHAYATGRAREYYNGTTSSAKATPVHVATQGNTPNINFSLEPGGSISGTVLSNAAIPLATVSVNADGGWFSFSANTGASGSYKIDNLPLGQYRIRAPAFNGAAGDDSWTAEYYNDKTHKDAANIVVLTGAEPNAVGIDFSLTPGSGTISGHVTDEVGNPLINVDVTANVWGAGWIGSSKTNSQGDYTIRGLGTGDYRVQASISGRVRKYYNNTPVSSSATPVHVTAPDATSNIDFSLEPGGTISGTVTSQATGLPLANVSVDAGPNGSGATTDSNGNYTITGLAFSQYRVNSPATSRRNSGDDGYIIRYYNNKPDSNSADLVTISASAPDAIAVNFALAQGASISGHIADEGGTPLTNADVWADYWAGGTASKTSTDAHGNYLIIGLATGDYRVQAQAAGKVRKYYNNTFDYQQATPVHVTPPNATPNINFSLESGGTISGTVTSLSTGLPLANIGVGASRMDGPGGGGATTNSSGVYTITGLPFGQYKVNAPTGKGSGDAGYVRVYYNGKPDSNGADLVAITSAAPNTTGINLSLAQGGSISGHVEDEEGAPLANADVWADYWAGGTASKTSTDAQGNYSILGLATGDYRVQSQAAGKVRKFYSSTFDYQQATPVHVTAPNTTPNINFSLEAGGTISGTITSQATGLPLANISVDAIRTDGPGGGGARTNASGLYTVTGLPFGQYKVNSPSDKRSGSGDDGFMKEYYNNKPNSGSADLVTISAGSANATGIDFALALGGTISGAVTSQATGLPLANISVDAWLTDKSAGVGATTDANGNYTITGLPFGQYNVQSPKGWGSGDNGYIREYYNNKPDWNNADLVTISAASPNVTGVNFALDLGGTVSGTVISQATGLPLANISVDAWLTDKSAGVGATTNASGVYTITGLPFGQYKVQSPKGWGSGDGSHLSRYYNDKPDWNSADLVTISAALPNATGVNFSLVQGGFITGTVLDEDTGQPVEDASYGSVNLDAGWHKLVYRFEEREGASEARAAFKSPGDTDWRSFSTSELEIRTSPDDAAPAGIILVTRKNNSQHPANHVALMAAVELVSTPDAGWYGESVVSAIDQNENIHGNDDYFTSRYEAYFYVDAAGDWWFSTDSDDASEIEIDDQVVAYWYNGHGSAHRWEQKSWVNVQDFSTGTYLLGKISMADGTYRLGPFQSGSYRVQAMAPGYGTEYYLESSTYSGATAVTVSAPAETMGINLTLNRATGSIFGIVTYSGAIESSHNIYVMARSPGSPSYFVLLTSQDGDYTIPEVPDGAYLVGAFLDADDNLTISPGDRVGFSPDPVIVSGGPSNVDIYLDDTPQGLIVGTLRLQGRQNTGEGWTWGDAWVWIDDGTQSFGAVPFPDGTFVIPGPVGAYDLHVEMPGYLPALRSGVVLDDITLYAPGQQPPQLPPLVLQGGDADGSGQVDIGDLMMIAANFGANPMPGYDGDINGDGVVNITDLVLAGMNFGKNESPWPDDGG